MVQTLTLTPTAAEDKMRTKCAMRFLAWTIINKFGYKPNPDRPGFCSGMEMQYGFIVDYINEFLCFVKAGPSRVDTAGVRGPLESLGIARDINRDVFRFAYQ